MDGKEPLKERRKEPLASLRTEPIGERARNTAGERKSQRRKRQIRNTSGKERRIGRGIKGRGNENAIKVRA
jgi:hypothetical protein